MPTKADINGRDLSKFQIVCPGDFVFNHRTSRNGSKFSIAYNGGERAVIDVYKRQSFLYGVLGCALTRFTVLRPLGVQTVCSLR